MTAIDAAGRCSDSKTDRTLGSYIEHTTGAKNYDIYERSQAINSVPKQKELSGTGAMYPSVLDKGLRSLRNKKHLMASDCSTT